MSSLESRVPIVEPVVPAPVLSVEGVVTVVVVLGVVMLGVVVVVLGVVVLGVVVVPDVCANAKPVAMAKLAAVAIIVFVLIL